MSREAAAWPASAGHDGRARGHMSAFSRRDAPEVLHEPCPSRKEGAGNAGCALHPRSRVQAAQRKTHTSIQVQRRHPASPARWLYGLCRALPGDEFVLSPSSADTDVRQPGWAAKTSADLTPATGARTTRFYRTQPPVFAQRLRRAMAPSSCAKDTAHGMNPPCNSVSRRRCRVHRIPSRVRDDRDPPLFSGETGRVKSLICPTAQAEYFLRAGLTAKSDLPVGQKL